VGAVGSGTGVEGGGTGEGRMTRAPVPKCLRGMGVLYVDVVGAEEEAGEGREMGFSCRKVV
jgi:hypothetical protein